MLNGDGKHHQNWHNHLEDLTVFITKKTKTRGRSRTGCWWRYVDEVTAYWSFMTCYPRDQIEKNEMGRACGRYGEEEMCIRGFVDEPCKKNRLEGLVVWE